MHYKLFFKKTAAIQESWLQVTKKVFWRTEKSCLERIMINFDKKIFNTEIKGGEEERERESAAIILTEKVN